MKNNKLMFLARTFALVAGITGLVACGSTNSSTTAPSSTLEPTQSSQQETSTTQDSGEIVFEGDTHNIASTLVRHTEGETGSYTFEAEWTDLTGKYGPGYSGANGGSSMVTGGDGASNNRCVSFLYAAGSSVNFLVVSDRDVEDATLAFSLGGEYLNIPLTQDVFQIRVDPVNDVDLNPATEDGALGAWDQAFLAYYSGDLFKGYYVSSFDCASSTINASSLRTPGLFDEYTITTHLRLTKGVNSISLIINGAELPSSTGTMECIAPVVDYMKIDTTAQLGWYGMQSNNSGTPELKLA